jgi:hypothetical protein
MALTKSTRARRAELHEAMTKIAACAFSTAFDEMWKHAVRLNPNGSAPGVVTAFLQAMRTELRQREEGWTEQCAIQERARERARSQGSVQP